jgi:hypothetical protein
MLECAPVTSRAAGRHRVPPGGGQPRPSLLLMDHPASDGPLAGYQARTFMPVASHRPGHRSPGRRHGLRPAVRSLGRDGALAVAAACLTTAVLVGIAQSPGTAVGGNAAPGLPQPGSPLPQPSATSPSPVTSPSLVTSPDRPHRSARPGRRTATTRARSNPVGQTSPSAAARQAAARPPAVVVRYFVASQGQAGFQGEIQVTNNTAQPIGDWQIVIALYDDAVTSFTNAHGLFSNGILVLSPANLAQVAPPDGGVLDVFFTADGFQTTPTVCAFDGISCG